MLKEILKKEGNSLPTRAKFTIEIDGSPAPALIGGLLGYVTFSDEK